MYFHFGDYVSVAEQTRRAQKEIDRLRKKRMEISPIDPFRGKIASTFWGKSWCDNLERYADASNRLDRGKRYVRAGSICHIALEEGHISALVSGTRLYKVLVKIAPMERERWDTLREACAKDIGSVLELLQGKFSKNVMQMVTAPEIGLFPSPEEIEFSCSCPDSASMCKHVAATLYAIGRMLDEKPEILFALRQVDPAELARMEFVPPAASEGLELDTGSLENIFGIDLDDSVKAPTEPAAKTLEQSAPAASNEEASTKAVAQMQENTAPAIENAGNSPKTMAQMQEKTSIRAANPKRSKKTKASMPRISPLDPANLTGAAILRLREAAGLTREAMAKKIGVTAPTLSRWENAPTPNLHKSSLEKLRKFEKKLSKKLAASSL